MKKVYIINHHAAGPGRHSNISRLLAQRGYGVTLFTSSFKHYDYKELIEYQNESSSIEWVDGYQKVWIKTPPYYSNGLKRVINQLVFTLRAVLTGRKLDRPDLIIGSSVHLFAAWAGYYLAKRHQVPFVFEVRDLWPQTLVDIGALKDKSLITYLLRRLEKHLYVKANKIISVLPQGSDYMAKLGIAKDKVLYVPNGIDIAWFDRSVNQNKLNPELEHFFNEHQDRVGASLL